MNRAAIFLAPGYEMAEAVIIVDILRRANINIDIVSVLQHEAVAAHNNLIIQADKILSELNFDDYNLLILPGGNIGVENLNKIGNLKMQLQKFAQDKNKKLAAICAAPQILGQLNLLDNKKIAFYPGCETGLEKAIKTKECVVISDNIITGKSVGCAFKFALAIVAWLTDKNLAEKVSNRLEF